MQTLLPPVLLLHLAELRPGGQQLREDWAGPEGPPGAELGVGVLQGEVEARDLLHPVPGVGAVQSKGGT